MTTTKKRINISVSNDLEKILKYLSSEEGVPVATKANELLKKAIEMEEDSFLEKKVESRGLKKSTFISHKKIWN